MRYSISDTADYGDKLRLAPSPPNEGDDERCQDISRGVREEGNRGERAGHANFKKCSSDRNHPIDVVGASCAHDPFLVRAAAGSRTLITTPTSTSNSQAPARVVVNWSWGVGSHLVPQILPAYTTPQQGASRRAVRHRPDRR